MAQVVDEIDFAEWGVSAGDRPVRVERTARRVRAVFAGTAIADSQRALLLLETGHVPVYYFPRSDVRLDLLEPTEHHTFCPKKGEASYWTIRVGDRVAENAVWGYSRPIAACPPIGEYLALYWGALDSWWEEDDEVFVHARDPYKRVDVLNGSRHVQVELGGVIVADSHRPRLLFETGLPTRYYLPKSDVRLDLLVPSSTITACPYKGRASYWTARIGEREWPDIAWSYQFPIPECPKLEGLIAFWDEHVDGVYVDGEKQPAPKTKWSR